VPYVRTVRTASGAIAVQIVYSYHRGSRQIEHIGSAHDDAELELLKAVARQRLAAGQGVLDLGPGFGTGGGGPLPITSSWMGHLLDALECAYRVLGLDRAAGGDEVFRDLVLARIIEPGEQAGQPAGAGGGRGGAGVVCHAQAAPAGLCEGCVAEIQAGDHVITAADPMPDDLRQAVDALNSRRGAY